MPTPALPSPCLTTRPEMAQPGPRTARPAAFTLVELLVVIAIIGTLVALLLPAVGSAREAARSNSCRNNLKQLTLALINYDSQQQELPGLTNSIANIANGASGRRASWVVILFPYMEQTPLWDRWSTEFPSATSAEINSSFVPTIAEMQCPSDPPDAANQPTNSYVANAGQAFQDTSRGAATPSGESRINFEYLANGVFFDLNKRPAYQLGTSASPPADGRESLAELPGSMNYIDNDGSSRTMMLSENIHALWYTYPDEITDPDTDNVEDAKHYFGFVWHNATTTDEAIVRRVNGARNEVSPTSLMELEDQEWYGYPSSNHPQGVNFSFADGHVRFVNESITPRVYAQMMTSNHKRSKYFDASIGTGENDTNASDRNLPQPSDADL